MQRIEFVYGEPAALLVRERVIAIGDLHIGFEEKLQRNGIHMVGATEKMADELLDIANAKHAETIAILGDIKESIGYADRIELAGIKMFFGRLSKEFKVLVAKGNHDGHIEEIFNMLEINAEVRKEIMLGDFALFHGNALPSANALKKKYLIVAHGHMAVKKLGKFEKVWLVAKKNNDVCNECAPGAQLIIAPAFSKLITGSVISERNKDYIPMLRRNMFNYENALLYSLNGKRIGTVKKTIKDIEEEKSD